MANNNKCETGFIASLLGAAASIAAMISYAVLSMDGEKSPFAVYVFLLLALGIQCAVQLAIRKGLLAKFNAGSICAAILSAVALVKMLLGRIEWLGGLAAHNASLAPMHLSFFVTTVLLVAGMVLNIASAFLKQSAINSAE